MIASAGQHGQWGEAKINQVKVVIINVMAVVDKMNVKNDEIDDCAGFAFKFMKKTDNQEPKFDEVRMWNLLDMMKCLLSETPKQPNLDADLRIYGQEETNRSITLHSVDVCKQDPFSELTSSCLSLQ